MNIELLKNLCETPGIAGSEEKVRDLILNEIKDLACEHTIDPMGNLIVHCSGTGPKVELLCHMDEIGFIVNYINDDGFIHVQPLGGFDARNLFSRRVLVCTDNGNYKGVMNPAGLPVHLAKPEDRKNVPNPDEFMIDIGMGKDTKDVIQIGDYVVMDEPFLELGKHRVVSKALDNRIACWLGIEALRNYEGNADLYPRMAPTCEWDTAAAHAIVEGAGGSVSDNKGKSLVYGKKNILNPFFVVRGFS